MASSGSEGAGLELSETDTASKSRPWKTKAAFAVGVGLPLGLTVAADPAAADPGADSFSYGAEDYVNGGTSSASSGRGDSHDFGNERDDRSRPASAKETTSTTPVAEPPAASFTNPTAGWGFSLVGASRALSTEVAAAKPMLVDDFSWNVSPDTVTAPDPSGSSPIDFPFNPKTTPSASDGMDTPATIAGAADTSDGLETVPNGTGHPSAEIAGHDPVLANLGSETREPTDDIASDTFRWAFGPSGDTRETELAETELAGTQPPVSHIAPGSPEAEALTHREPVVISEEHYARASAIANGFLMLAPVPGSRVAGVANTLRTITSISTSGKVVAIGTARAARLPVGLPNIRLNLGTRTGTIRTNSTAANSSSIKVAAPKAAVTLTAGAAVLATAAAIVDFRTDTPAPDTDTDGGSDPQTGTIADPPQPEFSPDEAPQIEPFITPALPSENDNTASPRQQPATPGSPLKPQVPTGPTPEADPNDDPDYTIFVDPNEDPSTAQPRQAPNPDTTEDAPTEPTPSNLPATITSNGNGDDNADTNNDETSASDEGSRVDEGRTTDEETLNLRRRQLFRLPQSGSARTGPVGSKTTTGQPDAGDAETAWSGDQGNIAHPEELDLQRRQFLIEAATAAAATQTSIPSTDSLPADLPRAAAEAVVERLAAVSGSSLSPNVVTLIAGELAPNRLTEAVDTVEMLELLKAKRGKDIGEMLREPDSAYYRQMYFWGGLRSDLEEELGKERLGAAEKEIDQELIDRLPDWHPAKGKDSEELYLKEFHPEALASFKNRGEWLTSALTAAVQADPYSSLDETHPSTPEMNRAGIDLLLFYRNAPASAFDLDPDHEPELFNYLRTGGTLPDRGLRSDTLYQLFETVEGAERFEDSYASADQMFAAGYDFEYLMEAQHREAPTVAKTFDLRYNRQLTDELLNEANGLGSDARAVVAMEVQARVFAAEIVEENPDLWARIENYGTPGNRLRLGGQMLELTVKAAADPRSGLSQSDYEPLGLPSVSADVAWQRLRGAANPSAEAASSSSSVGPGLSHTEHQGQLPTSETPDVGALLDSLASSSGLSPEVLLKAIADYVGSPETPTAPTELRLEQLEPDRSLTAPSPQQTAANSELDEQPGGEVSPEAEQARRANPTSDQ